MQVDVLKPRQLRKQQAWYYLPNYAAEKEIHIYQEPNVVIRINARKLYKELKAIYAKRGREGRRCES